MDRQHQQLDLGAIATAINDSNFYMTLGTADENGRPWVSPVYYAPEGYAKFYRVSSPEAAHSLNLTAPPEVSIVIFDSRTPVGRGQGVYMSAVAEELTGADLDRGIVVFSRRSEAYRVEPGGCAPARSPSPIPGHRLGALGTRPARPANTGECVGRTLKMLIHPSVSKKNIGS